MLKKTINLSIFLAILATFISGCGGGGSDSGTIIEPFVEENSFEYFPINSNATWIFSSQSWWLEDVGTINGYKSFAMTRELGTKEYYISDETGVYLIGLYLPEVSTSVGTFTADIKLDKPVPVLTQEMIDTFSLNTPTYYNGNGSVDISPTYGKNNVDYSATHEYVGKDQCSHALCMLNFRTQKVKLDIDISATIDGYRIIIPLSFYAEFAKGVGIVEFHQENDFAGLYLSSLSGIDIPEEHYSKAKINEFKEKIYGKQLVSHCQSIEEGEGYQRVSSIFSNGVIDYEGAVYSDAACSDKIADYEPWQVSYKMPDAVNSNIYTTLSSSETESSYALLSFSEGCLYWRHKDSAEHEENDKYVIYWDHDEVQCESFDFSSLLPFFPIKDKTIWVYSNAKYGITKFWFERISSKSFLLKSDFGFENTIAIENYGGIPAKFVSMSYKIPDLVTPFGINDTKLGFWNGGEFIINENSFNGRIPYPESDSGEGRLFIGSDELEVITTYDYEGRYGSCQNMSFLYGDELACYKEMEFDIYPSDETKVENEFTPFTFNIQRWFVEDLGLVKFQINDEVFELVEVIESNAE